MQRCTYHDAPIEWDRTNLSQAHVRKEDSDIQNTSRTKSLCSDELYDTFNSCSKTSKTLTVSSLPQTATNEGLVVDGMNLFIFLLLLGFFLYFEAVTAGQGRFVSHPGLLSNMLEDNHLTRVLAFKCNINHLNTHNKLQCVWHSPDASSNSINFHY